MASSARLLLVCSLLTVQLSVIRGVEVRTALVGTTAPDFSAIGVFNHEFKDIKLSEYRVSL